jgi:hypothetical protein
VGGTPATEERDDMTTKRTIAEIARDVYRSANSWDSDARIIGNGC